MIGLACLLGYHHRDLSKFRAQDGRYIAERIRCGRPAATGFWAMSIHGSFSLAQPNAGRAKSSTRHRAGTRCA